MANTWCSLVGNFSFGMLQNSLHSIQNLLLTLFTEMLDFRSKNKVTCESVERKLERRTFCNTKGDVQMEHFLVLNVPIRDDSQGCLERPVYQKAQLN